VFSSRVDTAQPAIVAANTFRQRLSWQYPRDAWLVDLILVEVDVCYFQNGSSAPNRGSPNAKVQASKDKLGTFACCQASSHSFVPHRN